MGKSEASKTNENVDGVVCTDSICKGTYNGAEFIKGSDIAHQFSNTMSKHVGDKLKELYDREIYSKVDMSKIKISTKGMGTGTVIFKLEIPFQKVEEKCDAYTSFDHVGGWNHSPELEKRKMQLHSALLKNDKLFISDLKRTKEGLQEYWIQWRNKVTQSECKE